MTPYQLSLEVEIYNEKKKAEQEEKLILTYLGAYWNRVKKMPTLKRILGKEEVKKQMTDEQMLERVKQLNKIFGGEEMTT